jgi:trigger factor
MQVTETLSDGLKREFQITVPAADLAARMSGRLAELKDRVQIRGFRPGKVPVTHLRKVYGRSVMAETIEAVIRETNAKVVEDNGLKLAMEPKVTIPNEATEVEKVIEGQSDLAYTLALEVLPKIELGDFKTITLERLSADVTDEAVDESLVKFAEQNKPFLPKAEGSTVESGDKVTIDFAGRIGGEPFEGGSGGDIGVNVGSGTFIPGFEEQLIGMSVGETRLVKVTFPENYPAATLAGKEAEFDVTAKSIEAPAPIEINEEFAKSVGLESLDKLKDIARQRIVREHAAVSRQKLKRQLLDQLDKMHTFAPPPTLVEDEFNSVWTAIEDDLKQRNQTFADEGTTEEKARQEYQAIAERRVRLGLVLAEIGERNKIEVTQDELARAVVERARQYPGREKEVWDHYSKNPQEMAGLRAPIFEEKVVDFIVELATVTDKTVTREELFKDEEAAGAAA